MVVLIYAFGVFLVLAGLLLVFNPGYLFELLNKNVENFWTYVAAIVVRIVLGGLLVYFSGISKFPLAISILGWLTVIAALILLAMGRKKFEKLVSWVIQIFTPFGRIAGFLSMVFGTFMIYAFI